MNEEQKGETEDRESAERRQRNRLTLFSALAGASFVGIWTIISGQATGRMNVVAMICFAFSFPVLLTPSICDLLFVHHAKHQFTLVKFATLIGFLALMIGIGLMLEAYHWTVGLSFGIGVVIAWAVLIPEITFENKLTKTASAKEKTEREELGGERHE